MPFFSSTPLQENRVLSALKQAEAVAWQPEMQLLFLLQSHHILQHLIHAVIAFGEQARLD